MFNVITTSFWLLGKKVFWRIAKYFIWYVGFFLKDCNHYATICTKGAVWELHKVFKYKIKRIRPHLLFHKQSLMLSKNVLTTVYILVFKMKFRFTQILNAPDIKNQNFISHSGYKLSKRYLTVLYILNLIYNYKILFFGSKSSILALR